MMIVASGIKKSYDTLQVLKGIDLEIKKGEMLSIVGPSGAGKSTFLHIIGTLDHADEGRIILEDEDPTVLSEKKLSAFRNKNIGFIFQFHHLLPEFTAIENVCVPAYIAGKSKKEVMPQAELLLKRLGLEKRISHKPNELSGGEQQRVAVARALINNPKVVLADEPSGNLDSESAEDLHQLFMELKNELNQTFVVVTHNEALANLADRKLIMRDGRITEEIVLK